VTTKFLMQVSLQYEALERINDPTPTKKKDDVLELSLAVCHTVVLCQNG